MEIPCKQLEMQLQSSLARSRLVLEIWCRRGLAVKECAVALAMGVEEFVQNEKAKGAEFGALENLSKRLAEKRGVHEEGRGGTKSKCLLSVYYEWGMMDRFVGG